MIEPEEYMLKYEQLRSILKVANKWRAVTDRGKYVLCFCGYELKRK